MDADQALADLTEISSQVVQVAVADEGTVVASTFDAADRAERFAAGAARLVAEADAARSSRGLPALTQLEAATPEGSIFVVCHPGGSRLIAAVTRPDPTVGLVFYDLRHCLSSIDEDGGAAEPAPRVRAAHGAEGDAGA